ncbi:hypothetical protein N566_18085 [Streptomycetaceae bacterium MP113-05]|nr:hypothetical protein N566_18085 [Streptomycetaceae bacterium MP113-05]
MHTHGTDARTTGHRPEDPESLAQLRGDCARMSDRWGRCADAGPPVAAGAAGAHLAAGHPHGVHVPERSAHLLDGMSDYGD